MRKGANKLNKQEQFQSIASFILEIGVLYTVIFFVRHQFEYPNVAMYIAVAMVPILAFYAHRLENTFRIPFFVWAIVLGSLFRDSLMPIIENISALTWLTTFLGILIIFGGGLEVKFKQFRKLLFPILSIAIIGALITSFLFSASLAGVSSLLGLPLTIGTIGLLGAMLCATDPAAILPTLETIKLKNPDTKTIAISESAVNDVLATIMTVVFAGIALNAHGAPTSLIDLYKHLFTLEVLGDFGKEIIVGVGIGFISYHLLQIWKKYGEVKRASFPFLIGVALTSFALSSLWGGSGYLATFITGLLFELGHGYHKVEEFFVNLVDGFVKPAVFVILGALILPSFWGFAGLGILMSILFMFLIRPLAVFGGLAWFVGRKNFQFRDLLFLDAVRETGVIPAVLLVSYMPVLPDGELAFNIGAWVIVATLIVLPLITKWWATKLRVVAT
ncbi:hypothetical protein GF380_03670 [Candidatus Uhrbacteria bacterium]|nr:hypothetical protein [Candidatus Uhrbacteria bacterium]MBD3284212.1 hypothetical protein [Candidatus Uhrbacteria bacterium]